MKALLYRKDIGAWESDDYYCVEGAFHLKANRQDGADKVEVLGPCDGTCRSMVDLPKDLDLIATECVTTRDYSPKEFVRSSRVSYHNDTEEADVDHSGDGATVTIADLIHWKQSVSC